MKTFMIKVAQSVLQTTFTLGETVSVLSVNGMTKLRPNKDPERIEISMRSASILARAKMGILTNNETKSIHNL